jgi:pimeloyl-ACP methyl ester carboxylesterase
LSAWIVRTVGVLLMLTAIGLSLSRAPDRPVETLVARWAPPPSDFLDLNGQLVHLRDEGPRGDPEPLLLIHGTGASLHTWEGWVKVLKARRRVISFDLPGFGLTGPWTGLYAGDDYRIEVYLRFVQDLMNALKLQRAVLVGNSLGGEIAWRSAVRAPQRVAALVLVDALGPAFTPQSVPLGFVMARMPVLNHLAEFALPRALVEQGLADVYGDPKRITSEQVDRYFELALRSGNRRALSLFVRQLVPGEAAAGIATLKLPTLILWGGRDRLIPPAVARDFQQRIAGSRLVMFDELGHVPQEEDPARSVQPVLDFLAPPK